MQIIQFEKPDQFVARTSSFLEQRETANSLVLGLSIRLRQHPDWIDTPPFLGVVEDSSGNIALAALMTPPYNILLSAPYPQPVGQLDQAISALIPMLHSGGWQLPGVNAENHISLQFAERWTQAMGGSFHVKTLERVYELRRVLPPPNPPEGRLRQADHQDRELLVLWHSAFLSEALGKAETEQASLRWADQRISTGDVFVWDHDGPVSLAIRSRPTRRGITIGSVYTPPVNRGRGYASACVAALSQLLLDSGKEYCSLFTDLSNPTSNAIYQKIGYRPVADFTEYQFAP